MIVPAADGRTFRPDEDVTLVRPQAAAAGVGVPHSTVRRWIHERRIPVYREGRTVWVADEHIIALEYDLRTAGVDTRRTATRAAS